MDLSFLDKSPDVTPILVRLYDSHKLYGLAKDKQPDARAELTSAVAELLNMELSTRETELIADVLIELVRQAETDLREALAERLSVLDNVPLRLILQIANDEINVARPVLTNSNALGDHDLIYIIKSKSTEYWQAIAERKVLNDKVIDTLADTNDIDTAIKLAENKNIKLTNHALTALSDVAQGAESLAQPLLQRDEITSELATALYKHVSEDMKQYISAHFPLESADAGNALDEIIREFRGAQGASEFAPTPQMLKAADRYKAKGLLTTKLMMGALRRGQVQAFIAQFSKFSGMPADVIEEILKQKTGQGLAVSCKALEVEKSDFISIYLLTNRVRNDVSMVNIKDMNRAVEYYDRITSKVAMDLMSNTSKITTDE